MTALEVVAIGARTPLGLSAESSAAAVRAGISSFHEFPFATPSGEPVIVSADSQLESSSEGRDRIAGMITSVVDEVMTQIARDGPLGVSCYLLLALPEPRPGFSQRDAEWVVDTAVSQLRRYQPNAQAAIGGWGHAGSIRAAELVAQARVRGTDGLFLIVGADTYHQPETFLWLERDRRFAQPGVRGGFIPGEGAGCLALMSHGLRRELRMPAFAVLGGVGTAQESLLRDSDTGCFGLAMTSAVLGATEGLVLPGEAIDTLYSDINGERYRSEEWGFVAMKTHAVWKALDYEVPCSCWGDVGAAFGPLAAVLAVQSFRRKYARGPRAMIMAGSDGGLRGALLLQEAGPVA